MNTFDSIFINDKGYLMRTRIVSLFILSIGVFFTACKQKKEDKYTYVNPEYSTYISAFTSGDVSRGKAIKVVLTQPIDTSKFRIGEALSDDLFDLSPGINGIARYSDPYTIEFVPEKWFKSGLKYEVAFDLKSISKDVPDELKEFNFNFFTIDLDYNILMKGIDKNSSYEKVNIGGEVIFTDVIDTTQLKDLIQVDGVEQSNIHWEKKDALSYEFTLELSLIHI